MHKEVVRKPSSVRVKRDHSANFSACALALAWILFIGGLGWASAETPSRILVLPFTTAVGDHEAGLGSFSDHAVGRIKAAIDMLGSRFVPLSEEATDELMKDKVPPARDEDAQALGSESGADFVVYGFLSYKSERYRMRGVMWDLRTGRSVVDIDMNVDNIHGLPGVLQVFTNTLTKRLSGASSLPLYRIDPAVTGSAAPSDRVVAPVSLPRSTHSGPWRSPEMEGAIAGLDVGDMVGDKKKEIVFVEDGRVTISRFDGGSLKPLTQVTQTPAVYVSAEVEDLDGDGVEELLLCYQTPSGLESSIARYVNRNFDTTAKFPNIILRTVPDPSGGKKRVLVGQRTDAEDMFSGDMVRFEMEGGKAVPSGTMELPRGTLLLSYTSGFMGEQTDFVQVILDQDQRLMVFDRDNRLLRAVGDRLYGLNRRIRIPFKNGYRDITLPGRLLITDTGGDGDGELLVVRQIDGMSEIQALSWVDGRFSEKWKTVRSRGIITDFRIRDFKSSGVRSLVLTLVKPSPFLALSGPRSVVYAYDLIP